MVAPLSDVPQESSSVSSLFSLTKLHLVSLPLACSYSRVAASSVFCAQNIFFPAQTRGAPLRSKTALIRTSSLFNTHYYWYEVGMYVESVCLLCVFFSLVLDVRLVDVPAGVTQEEGHKGFLIHFPSAVLAIIFLARRIQLSISLVDREVEFIVLHLDLGVFLFWFFLRGKIPVIGPRTEPPGRPLYQLAYFY